MARALLAGDTKRRASVWSPRGAAIGALRLAQTSVKDHLLGAESVC
jgi:hypothetical protein